MKKLIALLVLVFTQFACNEGPWQTEEERLITYAVNHPDEVKVKYRSALHSEIAFYGFAKHLVIVPTGSLPDTLINNLIAVDTMHWGSVSYGDKISLMVDGADTTISLAIIKDY